jgi:hypothetical protein
MLLLLKPVMSAYKTSFGTILARRGVHLSLSQCRAARDPHTLEVAELRFLCASDHDQFCPASTAVASLLYLQPAPSNPKVTARGELPFNNELYAHAA